MLHGRLSSARHATGENKGHYVPHQGRRAEGQVEAEAMQAAGGGKTTSVRCQGCGKLGLCWEWRVRERRGKRAEKPGFACPALSGYSRQGGGSHRPNPRVSAEGRRLHMDSRAVDTKSCTSGSSGCSKATLKGMAMPSPEVWTGSE